MVIDQRNARTHLAAVRMRVRIRPGMICAVRWQMRSARERRWTVSILTVVVLMLASGVVSPKAAHAAQGDWHDLTILESSMWPANQFGLRDHVILAQNDTSSTLENSQFTVDYYQGNTFLEEDNWFGDLLSAVAPGETVAITGTAPDAATRSTVIAVGGQETSRHANRQFRVNSVRWTAWSGGYRYLDVSMTNLNRTTATWVTFQAICDNAYAFDGWDHLRPLALAPGNTGELFAIQSDQDPPCPGIPSVVVDATSEPTTPLTAPSPPTAVVAVAGARSASVSWSPPHDSGGIAVTGYKVTASPGGATATVRGATTRASLGGLSNGRTYTFKVTATNPIGTSTTSSLSNAVVPFGVPGKASAMASVKGHKVTVSWKPAPANGRPVTKYLIRLKPGVKRTVPGGARKVSFSKLKRGTYKPQVWAYNAAGWGASAKTKSIRVKRSR